MASNGETKLTTAGMTVDQKLEVILEALTEAAEFAEQRHDELLERLANISTPGVDYGYED